MSTSPRVAVTNPLAQRIGVGRVRQVASLDRCMPPTITSGGLQQRWPRRRQDGDGSGEQRSTVAARGASVFQNNG
jgi:hypothetical protein